MSISSTSSSSSVSEMMSESVPSHGEMDNSVGESHSEAKPTEIFEEICMKLRDFDSAAEVDPWASKIENMKNQLRRSQEELIQSQMAAQQKIKTFDEISFSPSALSEELSRISEELDQERSVNSRLSGELAASVQENLKLKLEVQTLIQDSQAEVEKFKTFQEDQAQKWDRQMMVWEERLRNLEEELQLKTTDLVLARQTAEKKNEEIRKISDSLMEFEAHSQQQNEVMKNLSDVAEKKIIELKVNLDKKTVECQDYYSHLQKALTQINIYREENITLKSYLAKFSSLSALASAGGAVPLVESGVGFVDEGGSMGVGEGVGDTTGSPEFPSEGMSS